MNLATAGHHHWQPQPHNWEGYNSKETKSHETMGK
jgi:hypothetical protein